MKNKENCRNCSLYHKCRDSAWSWIFLFIGILAAIAMRLVALFIHVNPVYAKAAWYVGVSFFLVFFIYRYNISRFRSKSIKNRDLIKKVKEDENFEEEDKNVIAEVLCSLTSKKEMVNFAVIFILSGITLVIAIIADIIKYNS